MNWARLFASRGGLRPIGGDAAATGGVERSGRAQVTDVHAQILSAIDAQIDALGSVALVTGAGCRDRSATAVEQLLKSLRADRALLQDHWAAQGSPTSRSTAGPTLSRGCGQPQPCPHVLALARTYHVKLR